MQMYIYLLHSNVRLCLSEQRNELRGFLFVTPCNYVHTIVSRGYTLGMLNELNQVKGTMKVKLSIEHIRRYHYSRFKRVIKENKILTEIKRMYFRDKDQTWKLDTHNKENKITKKYVQSNKSK